MKKNETFFFLDFYWIFLEVLKKAEKRYSKSADLPVRYEDPNYSLLDLTDKFLAPSHVSMRVSVCGGDRW